MNEWRMLGEKRKRGVEGRGASVGLGASDERKIRATSEDK